MTKKGRISASEKLRIVSFLTKETNEQLAERFDRTLESIQKIRAETNSVQEHPGPDRQYVQILHTRYFWAAVQRQLLDADEKSYFENSGTKYPSRY